MTTQLCLEPITDDSQCQLLVNHLVPHSDDPDGGFIPVPSDPWSEIVPGLWQGGTIAGARYHDPSEGDFGAVLTLHRTAPFAHAPVIERRFPFLDGQAIPEHLNDAVDWAYQTWATQGKTVLVRCQAGLNRSGLIVALVLIKDGMSVEAAMQRVRERRSPYALCNRHFVDYLHSLS